MTTNSSRPDAFSALLDALGATYEAEIARITDVNRTRILGGEFSGDERDETPRYLRLEKELEKHPWLKTKSGRLAVESVSEWSRSGHVSAEDGAVEHRMGDCAAECMAHDVLALAVARGWVKGYRPMGPSYVLKVA